MLSRKAFSMKTLLAAMVLASALGAVSHVHANNDAFVCSLAYVPVSGINGQFGYVQADFHDQPFCGGNVVADRYYCSLGASSDDCPGSDAYVHQGRDSLLALTAQLQAAAQAGSHVYEETVNEKGFYIVFYGN